MADLGAIGVEFEDLPGLITANAPVNRGALGVEVEDLPGFVTANAPVDRGALAVEFEDLPKFITANAPVNRGAIGVAFEDQPSGILRLESLNEDDIISWAWRANDQAIINRVLFQIDWDLPAAPDEYGLTLLYEHAGSIAHYGPRPTLIISAQGLQLSDPTLLLIDERVETIFARFADPPPVLQLAIFYRNHLLEAGDPIRITHREIPNLITGQRGIVDELYEIVDCQPQLGAKGRVILSLLDVDALNASLIA